MTDLSKGGVIALAFIGGFLLAVLLAVLLAFLGAFAFMRSTDAYGLGHWKLNAKMPLTTMWMNLGYWEDENGEKITDFEQACTTLLKEILRTANLLPGQTSSSITAKNDDKASSLSVVDLGFGCGDQIVELVKLTQPPGGWTPDTFRYVGLTLNQSQVTTARRTLSRHIPTTATTTASEGTGLDADAFSLFCADAARPDSWGKHTAETMTQLAPRPGQKWLLALDCLYHFRPSRRPIFTYVNRHLLDGVHSGGIMAFDILLNPDKLTPMRKLILRVILLLMRCPSDAFLTEEGYRAQLGACGYDSQGATVRDVTGVVFRPVSEFLDRQERALEAYGVGMGGFKLAGRLFGWFARTGLVRGVIVVARPRESQGDKEDGE